MALRTGSGSGTVRIGNSGELQNITSLDATTAATIGGAAGGATTLIHDDILLPSASPFPTSIDLDLTDGFRHYRMAMSGVKFDSSSFTGQMHWLLKNASNTIVTGGYWGFATGLADSSVVSDVQKAWYEDSYSITNSVYRRSSFYGEYDFIIDIYNAHLTDQRTLIKWSFVGEYSGPNLASSKSGFAYQRTKEAHNYLHMYAQIGSSLASWRDGRYSMWGIDV